MPSDFRTYIAECYGQAPHAWRRGAVVMTVIINVVLLGALLLGSQFTQYPTAYFLIGTAVVAALDVLIILPYRLWTANRAEIASLKERLAPKFDLSFDQSREGLSFTILRMLDPRAVDALPVDHKSTYLRFRIDALAVARRELCPNSPSSSGTLERFAIRCLANYPHYGGFSYVRRARQ
jgi:hypothetical protein